MWVVLFNPLKSPISRTIISPILQIRKLKPERSIDLLEAKQPISGRAKPVWLQSLPSWPLCLLPQRVDVHIKLISRAAIEVKRWRGQLRNWCSFCRKQMFGVTYRTKCFIYTTCLYLILALFPFTFGFLSVVSFLDLLESILPSQSLPVFSWSTVTWGPYSEYTGFSRPVGSRNKTNLLLDLFQQLLQQAQKLLIKWERFLHTCGELDKETSDVRFWCLSNPIIYVRPSFCNLGILCGLINDILYTMEKMWMLKGKHPQ